MKRILGSILFAALAFCTVFILLCIYIPIHSEKATQKAAEIFYKKSPDLIVVYTGDAGRIELGFKKIEQFPNSQVFISGVHSKNSLKTILNSKQNVISVEDFLQNEGNHIELDYLARNTVENVLATLYYLRQNKRYKDVLVLSSDYHILRIQLILYTLLLEEDNKVSFYYEGVKTDFSQWRNIKILMKEVFKLMKTSSFLLFWDKENFL